MTPPAHRTLTLADVMVLIAMTAVGLASYVLLDGALFGAGRYFFGLFRRPLGPWCSEEVLDLISGVVALLLPLVGGWTLALPVLRFRRPRPSRRRLGRQSGVLACIAATAGMALFAGAVGCLVLLRWSFGSRMVAPTRTWRYAWAGDILLDHLVVSAGLSVVSVWVVQALTGRWRRPADWIDRLGRWLGWLWIAAGLVFLVRTLMRY